MHERMSWEGRLRGVVAGIFVVVATTGVGTLLVREPPPWVQLIQLAHGALGVALLPWVGLYVLVHVVEVFGPSVRSARRLPWILPVGLVLIVSLFAYPAGRRVITAEQRAAANLHNRVIALLLLGYVIVLAVRALRRGVRASTATGLLLVALGVVGSLAGLLTVGGIAANGLWYIHVITAGLVLAAGGLHVLGSRRRARVGGESAGRVFAWRAPLVRVAAPVAALALALVASFVWRQSRVIEPLVGDPDALVNAGKDFAAIVPDACDGCHISVSETWRVSTHAYAARNPLFTGMVRRLAAARGGAAVVECLQCHAPHAADPRRVGVEAAIASEGYAAGVHCVSCHRRVASAGDGPLPIAVTPLSGAGRRFLSELSGSFPAFLRGTSEVPSVLVSSRIGLHRREFRAALAAPVSCRPCHFQTLGEATGGRLHDVVQDQYGSWENAAGALDRASCQRCHMPRFYAFEGYVVLDHRFLGGSTYVARIAGGEAAEADVVAHLKGNLPIPARGAVSEPPAAALPLVRLTATLGTRAGQPIVRIETRATERVGHAFAEGPNDLTQTWLAIRVRAADGRELVNRGFDGPEDGVRLGKRLWDAEGMAITDHRLWPWRAWGGWARSPRETHAWTRSCCPPRRRADRCASSSPGTIAATIPRCCAQSAARPSGVPVVTVATLVGDLAEGVVLSSAPP
ncbi:MAG: multiheme c-type cytochrome [bacterium]